MDIFQIIFSSVLVIITIVLAVVGIQVVFVLNEIRKTVNRFNTFIDTAEAKLDDVTQPLRQLGGMVSGVQSGLRIFDTFVQYLHRDRDRDTRV